MTACLLDTGPLIAYLNGRDPFHASVSDQLDSFSGQLITSSAVITETMHFVRSSPAGPGLVAEFVAVNRVKVHGSERPAELRVAAALMRQYEKVPMDYADATLLLLSDRLQVEAILTLDRRGFSAYRTPRGRALRQLLSLG